MRCRRGSGAILKNPAWVASCYLTPSIVRCLPFIGWLCTAGNASVVSTYRQRNINRESKMYNPNNTLVQIKIRNEIIAWCETDEEVALAIRMRIEQEAQDDADYAKYLAN